MIAGLAWTVPLAELHGAAPSRDRAEARATAILEVRAIDGARVDIDGATRGEASAEVQVSAGRHRIEVSAPGYLPWRATVWIESGARVTVNTELVSADLAARVPLGPSSPGHASVFLPARTGPRTDVFMPTLRIVDADVLLPTRRRVEADVFMPTTRTSASDVFLPTPPGTP